MRGAAAIYLRTSLEDGGKAHGLRDQSLSIANQRKMIRDYLKSREDLRELEAVEYIDDGFTGTNLDRPRFQDMLRDIEGGGIGVVIVKDLSRLGRSYLEVGNYLERIFPMAGVRVIAINDGYDSADFAGVTGGIDVAFRNFIYDSYSRDLSTKVRSAMRVRMEKGTLISHPPYGYMRSPGDRRRMTPDPETAPVVRSIFRMVLEGRTTAETARSLNDRGILTPLQYKRHKLKKACQDRELIWTHSMVVNILHNYKYTGAMVNHMRESRHLRDNNQRRTRPEEWLVTEDAHEPLVSKEDFEQANAMLRHPRRTGRDPGGREDAVFYCGHCGRKLRRSCGSGIRFVCDTPCYKTQAACRGLCWSKGELEAVLLPVYRAQLDLLGERAAGLQKKQRSGRLEDHARQMARIERELRDIDGRKIELFEGYHDGALDLSGYMEQKTALREQESQLRRERAAVEAARRKDLEDRERQREAEARLSACLSAAQIPGEQLISRMYEAIDRVDVLEKSIRVRWKFEDLFAGTDGE